MSAILIPTQPTPAYFTENIALDGVNYILLFIYNDRTSTWDMQIQDANGNPLCSNIPMVSDYPLNYRMALGQIPGMPPGLLVVLDDTGQNRDPDNTNFGQGVNLYYNPVADLEAL